MGGNESIIGDVEYYCYIASKIRNNLNYSIMKRFILIIALISFGLGMAYADGPETLKVEENDAKTDLVLYQQATKALKNQKFLIKVNRLSLRGIYDHDPQKTFSTSDGTTYVLLNGNDISISLRNGRANQYGDGLVGVISDIKLKEDKKGNVVAHTVMKRKAHDGFEYRKAVLKLSIKKGTNECILACRSLRGFGINDFELTGELLPYETSDLVTVGLVDKIWNR